MASADSAYKDEVAPEGSPFRPLYDDRIWFSGQPVALVVAEEPEIARFAASLVRVEYDEEAHVTDLYRQRDKAVALEPAENPFAPPKPRGAVEPAFAAAAVRHRGEYCVPIEHHNPMELFASTVIFEADGKLTIYDKTQGVQNVQRYLCSVLEMEPDAVRVMSPFVGGAFGSGLRPQFQVVLAALAARALQRSVRLVLTRQQMYVLGYRPAMIQQIELAANAGGTLEAIAHDAITVTSQYEDFHRQETGWSGLLYKSAHAKYTHKLARLDLATPCDMRAPSAAPGAYALECAMDELAVALKLGSARASLCGVIRSATSTTTCRTAARACGIATTRVRQRSVGTSAPPNRARCATAPNWSAGAWRPASGKRCRCRSRFASCSPPTAMPRFPAQPLTSAPAPTRSWRRSRPTCSGCRSSNVTIKLGNSTLPQSPVEGGSWIAASVSNGIVTTADAVCDELLRLAKQVPNSPLADAMPEEVALADGKLVSKRDASRAVSIADAMRHGGVDRIEQEKSTTFADDGSHAHNTHSAVFAEVKVDEQLGIIRVTRVVSAVAAGRILNTKTARSQIIGGVVWGIGMALHEETLIDHKFGRVMNANIAEYHVPVNADVQDIEVIFVDEPDSTVNPLGIKGLGEIGIVGVAAAIANAIYHATGKRVRDLPITLDKLMRD